MMPQMYSKQVALGFPGLCGFSDIFIKPTFIALCIFENKNKNLINTNDIGKQEIILHVNMSLFFPLQHIVNTTIHSEYNSVMVRK